MNANDTLPKTVCQPCTERIQLFDKFCDDVKQNQYLLQVSMSKEVSSGMETIAASSSLIQLSPVIVPKCSQTLIITLQTNSSLSNAYKSGPSSECSKSIDLNPVIEPEENPEILAVDQTDNNSMNVACMERELDELATDDIASDVHSDSENEDEQQNKADNSIDDSLTDIHNENPERYRDFPTPIIDGCRLLYKGRDLLEMISKFYRLECDQCQ